MLKVVELVACISHFLHQQYLICQRYQKTFCTLYPDVLLYSVLFVRVSGTSPKPKIFFLVFFCLASRALALKKILYRIPGRVTLKCRGLKFNAVSLFLAIF